MPVMEPPLTAAMRDCSNGPAPRGKIGVMYHAIVTIRGEPHIACGAGVPYMDSEEAATGLLESEKCQRSGCKQAFARERNRG